jgi:hypothetical protein
LTVLKLTQSSWPSRYCDDCEDELPDDFDEELPDGDDELPDCRSVDGLVIGGELVSGGLLTSPWVIGVDTP